MTEDKRNWDCGDLAPGLMRLVQLIAFAKRNVGKLNPSTSIMPSTSSATAFWRMLPDAIKVKNRRQDMALMCAASSFTPHSGAADDQKELEDWRTCFE